MLFSLTNLKRRAVRDPEGELAVVPKLLHGRSTLKLVEQAIDLFESFVGKPRSEYDSRTLEAVMGDYRLGRCIEACLLTRYSFLQPQVYDVLTEPQLAALQSHGLATPSDLRFALWDAVNERYGGFAPPASRSDLLASLAQEWDLPPDPALLESLLTLDSDTTAILTRTGDTPTPHEIVLQYNRGAVRTLLAHSTHVKFAASHLPGAALKRLYFVAKRRGVLVDIESDNRGGFNLLLYGPEQAFGTADKNGRRLADVTLSLLRSLLTMPDAPPDVQVAAVANLVLHDRPYRFYIGSEILSRLEYTPERDTSTGRIAETTATYSVGSSLPTYDDAEPEEPSFDSLVEARLYKEYRSLERQGYTHGWTMQREPEPVLAPGIVFIPDFAFLRGDTRVFMEIAGFWSPTYRERKVAKLRALASSEGYAPLILAVPLDAEQTFSGLPFPIVPYKNKVAATDLLTLLDRDYGAREERHEAAQSHLSALRSEAIRRGFVPDSEIAQTLHAYTRTELLTVARSLDGEGCRYIPGVGLLSDSAIARLTTALTSTLESAPNHRLDLQDASALAASTLNAPQIDLESLLPLWPSLSIDRPSLFEAYLTRS
jgi:predicted nuclease of restriction endonuclease-like RecB superfamily